MKNSVQVLANFKCTDCGEESSVFGTNVESSEEAERIISEQVEIYESQEHIVANILGPHKHKLFLLKTV